MMDRDRPPPESNHDAEEGTGSPALFSWDALRVRFEDDYELIRELVQILGVESKIQLDRLRSAVATHDLRAAQNCAHTLRGSISNFESAHCVELVSRLEKGAKSGDLSAAPELIEQLDRDVRRLLSELESKLASL